MVESTNYCFRWFRSWGLSIQSEKEDRLLAKDQELGDINTEKLPMTFPLKTGKGTEVRPATCVWIDDLASAIQKHLEENQR